MRFLHKIIYFLSIALILFALACKNTGTDKAQVSNQDTTTTVTATEEKVEETDTEPVQQTGHSTTFYIIITLLLIAPIIYFLIYIQLLTWIDARLDHVRISWMDMFRMRWEHVDAQYIVENMKMAKNAGLYLTCKELVALYLAKIDFKKVVNPMIVAHNAGVKLSLAELKTHHLANGNVERVIQALVMAKNVDAKLPDSDKLNLSFATLANMDLAGVNVLQVVTDAINFKVVSTDEMTAFAQDGIELKLKAKVTVRTKIGKFIGGTGEATLLARVSEAIVTQIGLAKQHTHILENPYELGEVIIHNKSLFADTVFQVYSVDIVNMKVGTNVRAEQMKEEAEVKILQEKAREQEMKAKAQAARARVIEAEIEVQKAMAGAFIEGNFSIDNYLKMKNIEADTKMRDSFALDPNETDA